VSPVSLQKMESSSQEIELSSWSSGSDAEYLRLTKSMRKTVKFAKDPNATSTDKVSLVSRKVRKRLIKFGADRSAASSNPQAPRDQDSTRRYYLVRGLNSNRFGPPIRKGLKRR